MQLALGTVQFGLRYGIAGRGEPVPESEVTAILQAAWDRGIRMLDTATAYGDIEERLAGLTQRTEFTFVSKIPPLPSQSDESMTAEFVDGCVRRCRARLEGRLAALLFHRGADLLESMGEVAWQQAQASTHGTGIRLGVSCYSPADLHAIRARAGVTMAQLPGNALDQRLLTEGAPAGVELHLRSALLQGLLMLPVEEGSRRVVGAGEALSAWARFCSDHGLAPLQAALSVVKGFPGIRYCVLGVDRLEQLHAALDAWERARPIRAPELACTDLDVIDPRRWGAKSMRQE
ncbi:MAG TPA: aldo/keto reductase [Steroidobacter sp.]|uniref:aldo/keto reductase n=1 Tax=Steroidobacter sp. TaxID=1978227 RepID=UPI002EDB2F40